MTQTPRMNRRAGLFSGIGRALAVAVAGAEVVAPRGAIPLPPSLDALMGNLRMDTRSGRARTTPSDANLRAAKRMAKKRMDNKNIPDTARATRQQARAAERRIARDTLSKMKLEAARHLPGGSVLVTKTSLAQASAAA